MAESLCPVCAGPRFLCGGCPLGVPRGLTAPPSTSINLGDNTQPGGYVESDRASARSQAELQQAADERRSRDRGNWMQTIGGRAFYVLDPRPEEVDIDDIAHALSMLCRFGGHCTRFYSVAEHCVRVSTAIEEAGGTVEDCFVGLMHDAAEAYIGDMVWPLKRAPESEGYKAIERRVEAAIAERFGFAAVMPAIVKRFDLVLLSTEKRDLMNPGIGREDGSKREALAALERLGPWHSDIFPALPGRIVPWGSELARLQFLNRFSKTDGAR